jgi:hypothetical protein
MMSEFTIQAFGISGICTMNKRTIIAQIAVLRHSAEQLENQVQKVLAYCAHVDALVDLHEVDWGGVALPVSAEDIGTLALTCVKRAVKLDVLISLASEGEYDTVSGVSAGGTYIPRSEIDK